MGSENSKTERFIDDAEDVVNTLRKVTNVLSNNNRRSTPSFVRDAEDMVNTMKLMNNFSKLLSRDKRHVQSSQKTQPQGQQNTNRAQFTTEQRTNISPTQPSLERARTPYNYTNRDLVLVSSTQARQRLYPNLDNVNRINEMSARNDGEYVYISHYQQRTNPSAPPAADVMELPEIAPPASDAPQVPQVSQKRYEPRNPGPSNVPHSVLPKKDPKPRSVSRGRFIDPRFNCPTCAQRFGLTIYLCEIGHGACKDCYESNRVCGSNNGRCRAPITGIRNIALEACVAENSRNQLSQCENERCTLRFDIPGMEKHLEECPFGETDCPMGKFFGKCSFRGKVEDLALHFDSCHKEQRGAEFDKEMFIFNLSMDVHKLYLIRNGPYNFLLHIKVSAKDSRLYMAVQLIGSAMSSAKWTYEFHIYNKRKPLRKYLYAGNCHSLGTPLNEMLSESKCAALPTSYAMSFANENALTYKFFIMKTGENRPRRPNNEWKRRNLDN